LIESLINLCRETLGVFSVRFEDDAACSALSRHRSRFRRNRLPAAGPADERVNTCVLPAGNSGIVSAIQHYLSCIGRAVAFISRPVLGHDLLSHSRQRQLEAAVGSLRRL